MKRKKLKHPSRNALLPIARAIRRHGRDRSLDVFARDIDDVLQDLHVKVLAILEGHPTATLPYVYKALWNYARDERGRAATAGRRTIQAEILLEERSRDPVRRLEARACLSLLERRLSPDDFTLLRDVAEDRDVQDIADDRDLSRSGVYFILARARNAARTIVDRQEGSGT